MVANGFARQQILYDFTVARKPRGEMREHTLHAGGSFIISTARSGSTLLRYILDSHPEILCPPELFLGRLCRDLYLTVGYIKRRGSEARESIVLEEVRRIIFRLMDDYAAENGKRMWCEKTPTNVDHLKIMTSVFPEAKYICLYRHCLDVTHSLIEASANGWAPDLVAHIHRSPDNIISAVIESWIDKTRRILEMEQSMRASCFRIKYESLVLDPLETLKPLFDFLCVEWDERVIDRAFSVEHDFGLGDVKARFSSRIKQDSIGKGSKLPLSRISRDQLEKMNDLLKILDYPQVGSDCDITVHRYKAGSAESKDRYIEKVKRAFVNRLSLRTVEQRRKDYGLSGLGKFVIPELAGEAWMLDLTAGAGHLAPAGSAADFSISISVKDLEDLVEGRVNAGEAFLQGKLRVDGNLKLADRAFQVFFREEFDIDSNAALESQPKHPGDNKSSSTH